jgi:hypothetical protein
MSDVAVDKQIGIEVLFEVMRTILMIFLIG